ncbi:unnamed protein product, partial [Ectocarpus sp. 12 AP-2014]
PPLLLQRLEKISITPGEVFRLSHSVAVDDGTCGTAGGRVHPELGPVAGHPDGAVAFHAPRRRTRPHGGRSVWWRRRRQQKPAVKDAPRSRDEDRRVKLFIIHCRGGGGATPVLIFRA